MGFFDELKKEISQAVTELVSDEELLQEEEVVESDVSGDEDVHEEQEYFDEDDYIETDEDFAKEEEYLGVVVDDYASDEYVNTLNIDIADLVKSYSDELTENNDYSYAQASQMLENVNNNYNVYSKSESYEYSENYDNGEKEQEYDSDDVMVDTLGSLDFTESDEQPVEENVSQETIEEITINEGMVQNISKEYDEENISEQASGEDVYEEYVEESVVVEDVSEELVQEYVAQDEPVEDVDTATEETSLISRGLTVKGDIVTEGSVEILGTVEGNVKCKGKLNVGGYIYGYCEASEIYANGAHISGDIVSKSGVWIGQDSVIVGNIFGESAVIAGAIKGDIDIHGPVVVDSTAIVMGDIKSKSVQIEIGAAIEGRCSQCYADVSPISFFKEN